MAPGDEPATGNRSHTRLVDRKGRAYCGAVGAAVTVVLSMLPCSSVLGGAVAAARYDGGYLDGLLVGGLAGVGAAVPLAVLFVPAVWIAGAFGFGVPPSAPGYGLFLAVLGALFLVYTVGLSAVGGVLGVRIEAETGVDLDPGTWLG
jgi:hypothetical protein